MKKLIPGILFLLIGSSALLVSCKDDSDGTGPDVVLRTDGFLCTMGIDTQGHEDTLTYFFSTAGQEVTVYGYGQQRPEDGVRITLNSNSTVAIEKKIPYVYSSKSYKYFGIIKNVDPSGSPFPSNEYLYNFYIETATEETEFIIKRSSADINKFTIESKKYPGYYLGMGKAANSGTSTLQDHFTFTSKQKEFFFMEK